MATSHAVPTYPVDGEYITATKMSGTAYDDIAVKGIQIFGNQTLQGNAGAAGYITAATTGVAINAPAFHTSTIFCSTLNAGTVVAPGVGTTITATIWMSTPTINADTALTKSIVGSNMSLSGTLIGNNATLTGTVNMTGAKSYIQNLSTLNLYVQGQAVIPNLQGTFLNGFSLFLASDAGIQGNAFINGTVTSVGGFLSGSVKAGTISTGTLLTAPLANLTTINTSTINASNINTSGLITGPAFASPSYSILYAGIPGSYIDNGTAANTIRLGASSFNFVNPQTGNTTIFSLTGSGDATFSGIVAAPTGTFTTLNATSQNFTGLLSFANASGTGNLTVQQYISSASLYTKNANVSTLLTAGTAQFNTLSTGSFAAGELDTKLVSSITGNIQFNLVSTLQLQAKVSVSPNINLGLGDVIQGLVGGAATQALGVGIGTAGLITGAVALVTGRTQGGVNNTVFQTVNGSTQLQFSTIGESALSVFLTTNSSDPLHLPGTEIRQSVVVPANTYCVRSVSDPLYVDSSTQSIQMFGQWVPVIQAGATFGVLNTSNLNTSSLTAVTASISTLTVSTLIGNSIAPLDLTASSITMSGNLVGTNQNANINWAGSSKFLSTTTQKISLVDAGNTFQGEIYGINQPNTGVTVVAPNGLRIQNSETPLIPTIGFNTNSTVDIYSTLRVSQIQNYGTANISTLNVSTLNATIQSVIPSTLNVSTMRFSGDLLGTGIGTISTQALFISSINGLPPGGGGGGLTIPSTLYASTINANGRITVTTNSQDVNGGIYLPFPGTVSTYFIFADSLLCEYGTFTSTLQTQALTVTGTTSINVLNVNNIGVTNIAGINIANTNTLSVTGTATIGTANINTAKATRYIYADTNNNLRGYATGGNQDISQIGVFTVAPTGFYVSLNDNYINPLMSLTPDFNARFYSTLTAPYIETQNVNTPALQVTNSASISTLTVSTIIGGSVSGNPVGSVIIWAGGLADNTNFQVPTGYLLCDGTTRPVASYPALYAVIGTLYQNRKPTIAGSFYLPDLTFAVPMGTPAKGASGYAVSITFTTAGTSSYQYLPTDNTTWNISGTTYGTLVIGTVFPSVPGVTGSVYVKSIITYDGNAGQILVQNGPGIGTPLPNFATATTIVSQGVINPFTAGNAMYDLGSAGIYGNAQPYRTQDPTEVGVHTHSYINGPDTTDNVAGGTSLCGFGTKTSGTNSGSGQIQAPAITNTSLQYPTAPNFVNMSYIIKF
jgi:hypothetical protein